MRRMTLLAVLAVCALASLAAASVASAAPEVGRCVPVEGKPEGKKTVYNGGYKGKNCRHTSPTHTGKWEWLPGAGESPTFESISEDTVKLVTSTGTTIECLDSQTFGEITGAKTEKTELYMVECKDAGSKVPCQSLTPHGEELPKEGTIHSESLTGELGFVEGEKKVGWDVKPETGSVVMTFECGTTPTGKTYVVEGSYVDRIRGGTNKMAEETHEIYKQKGGVNQPEHIEGGAPDTLTAKTLVGLELVTVPIGFEALEEHYSEEELEYRASVIS